MPGELNIREPDPRVDHVAHCEECEWAYWSTYWTDIDLMMWHHSDNTGHDIDSAKCMRPAARHIVEEYDWPDSPSSTDTTASE